MLLPQKTKNDVKEVEVFLKKVPDQHTEVVRDFFDECVVWIKDERRIQGAKGGLTHQN